MPAEYYPLPQRYRPPAYTIDEFAKAHGVSVSMLYKLWQQGQGPRRMRVGNRVLVSEEAALRWCRERERAAESELASRKTKPA
jgi:hypothetical protein